MANKQTVLGSLLIASLLGFSGALRAEDAPLDLNSLDQRLKIAERKLELADENAGAAKSSDAIVSAGPGGFLISSADKSWSLKLSGLVQADNRTFFEDQLKPQSNLSLPRRARFQVDAGLGSKAKLRLQTELVTGGLIDAYGELKLLPWATLRTGLFKTPISLERWRSDPNRDFIELGYTAALVTDRDTGAWLELADKDQIVSLGAGIFNGSVDSSAVIVTDTDDDKDLVAKFFTHPFRYFDVLALRDLGFGVATSSGNRVRSATSGANQYRPTGQSSGVFTYSSTEADGASLRLAPQAYWFYRGFSFLGEYVRSSQELSRTANTQGNRYAYVSNEGYQAQLGWVITGEDASFSGLKLNKETSADWGALQVVGRYQGVNFDPESFHRFDRGIYTPSLIRFADPRTSVSSIRAWGLGLNYVPVNNVKVSLNWEESSFTDGATKLSGATTNRETEKVLLTRFQYAF